MHKIILINKVVSLSPILLYNFFTAILSLPETLLIESSFSFSPCFISATYPTLLLDNAYMLLRILLLLSDLIIIALSTAQNDLDIIASNNFNKTDFPFDPQPVNTNINCPLL